MYRRCRGALINITINLACRLTGIAGVMVLSVAFQPLCASEGNVAQQQRQAMAYARAGDHARALDMLQTLREKYPERYSIKRDFMLVASWSGDCDRVIDGYRSIQQKNRHYSRVAVPAAQCLRERNRVRESITLLNKSLERNPGNQDLQKELKAAQNELASQRYTTDYFVETDSSDAGNVEWRAQAMIWGEVADHVFARARYIAILAADPQFATGDLNRVGFGVEYYEDRFTLDGELSTDLFRANESGVSVKGEYRPTTLWDLAATYHSFSEQIPLRAAALGITSNQFTPGVSFHTPDYVWEWLAELNWMDFTDGNERREWFTELGYGLELTAKKEKRLVFELSHSTNTLPGTVYFNPLSAETLIGGYKSTRVLESKYKRKTDELYPWLGYYQQQGFGSDVIIGARYGRTTQIDDSQTFRWFLGAASMVYDGDREAILDVGIFYTRVLK